IVSSFRLFATPRIRYSHRKKVASKATFSRTKKRFVKYKQSFIDFENIVLFPLDEIADDQVELVAIRQAVAGGPEQFFRLIEIQFERDRKRQDGLFLWRI